jgi:Rrf2 family transcriptional regulator, cysteine metabolism repressor
MNLLTRKTDYAVKALLTIAKAEKPMSANELTEKLAMPKAFLRGILQRLASAGLLASSKGSSGGFSLAKPARDITLSSAIKTFQGKISFNECMFRKKLCPDRSSCPLRKELLAVESDLIKRFDKITIASLLKNNSKEPGK